METSQLSRNPVVLISIPHPLDVVVRESLRTELSKNCGISCGLIVSESAVLLFYFAYLVDSILLEVDKMIIPTKLGCLHI